MNQSPQLQPDDGLRVVVPRAILLSALKDVLPVAPRNAYLPILGYVLLTVERGRLSLRTSNINSGIQTWLDPVNCGSTASACVPAHLLAELVNLLPEGNISLTATRNDDLFQSDALVVNAAVYEPVCFKTRVRLRGLPANEFPVSPPLNGQAMTIASAPLLSVIRQVRHFVDREEKLPVLGGVLLRTHRGKLTAVATDRICLALAVEELPLPDLEVVVELEALDVLAKHLTDVDEVGVMLSDERAGFRLPNLEITGRLLGGAFPDYERVLPTGNTTRAVVDRVQVVNLANGLGRLSQQDNRQLEMAVSGNGDGSGRVSLSLNSEALGYYQGHVPAVVEGEPVAVHCFSHQLLQALRALPAAEISIEFTADGQGPITLRAGQNRQLIMPLIE